MQWLNLQHLLFGALFAFGIAVNDMEKSVINTDCKLD